MFGVKLNLFKKTVKSIIILYLFATKITCTVIWDLVILLKLFVHFFKKLYFKFVCTVHSIFVLAFIFWTILQLFKLSSVLYYCILGNRKKWTTGLVNFCIVLSIGFWAQAMIDYCSINTFCFNVWHYFLKVEIADFLFIADFEHTAGRRNNFVNRTNAMIRYDLLQKNIFNQRTYFSGYFSKFKCISLNLEHTVIVFPTYFVNILNIYFFLFEIKKLSVDTTYTLRW